MEQHRDYSDQEFVRLFSLCELPPGTFTHEAHLRLAWLQLKKFDQQEAEENVIALLKQYVTHVGAEQKFNLQLTIASVRIVGDFMTRSQTSTFQEFLVEFPELKNKFKGLVESRKATL